MAELLRKYAELEQKLVDMRSKAKTEVTSFLDDEIGTKLDKISRQVARIESRLHTYHEVNSIPFGLFISLCCTVGKKSIICFADDHQCIQLLVFRSLISNIPINK